MDEIKRGNLYIADLDPVKGSEQDAVKDYKLAEKEFKQQQRKAVMTGKNRQEVMLKDYLIYWYEEVFSQ